MKREYVEQRKDHSSNSTRTTMFGDKLHQNHHNIQQVLPHHLHPPPVAAPSQPTFHHPFQLSTDAAVGNRECQTSEEADSRSSPTMKPDPLTPNPVSTVARPPSSANDGATIEVARRPRGRPRGSKNKPKPPVIITRESEPSMSPFILEIPGGNDVINSVTKFCRKRNLGLCILNGSGTVTNVTLRQPSTTPVSTVTFHSRFDILSISATIVQLSLNYPWINSSNGLANGFTISLAGPQGHVVGGAVVGPLVSAGTVYLIAATFNNPSIHRLPIEDDQARNSGGNEGSRQSPPQRDVSGGGGDSGHPPAAAVETTPESCGMSMYSCHLPSDVIWGPTARQPPPPPPRY